MSESSGGSLTADRSVCKECGFELPASDFYSCPKCRADRNSKSPIRHCEHCSKPLGDVCCPCKNLEATRPVGKPHESLDTSEQPVHTTEASGEPPLQGRSPTAILTTSSSSSPHPDQQSSGGCDAVVSTLPPNSDLQKPPTQETAVRPNEGSGESKRALVTGKDDDLFFDALDNAGSTNGSGSNVDIPGLQKQKEGQSSEVQQEDIQEEKRLQREKNKPVQEVAKSDLSQTPVLADTDHHTQGVSSESSKQRDVENGGRVPEGQAEVYKKSDKPPEFFSGATKMMAPNTKDPNPRGMRNSGSATEDKKKYNYLDHPRSKSDLKGLSAKREGSIAVTFHCILPKSLWCWNDETSHIYMRFEGSDLGNWQHNVGKFKQKRQLGEGVYEMTCTLIIDAETLKAPKAYKYVVYSPKMVRHDDCFEFLHSFAGQSHNYGNPNRCLKINHIDNTYGGECHQYDFFVYPRLLRIEKGFLESGMAWLASILKRSSTKQSGDKDTFSLPTSKEMVRQCLFFYLEPYKTLLLNGEYPEDFRVDEFTKQVKIIYSMHHKPHVKHPSIAAPTAVTVIQINEIKTWLEGIVAELQNVESLMCQFVSSVCIACCVLECQVSNLKFSDFVSPLLKMLRVQPNVESKVCLEISYLMDVTEWSFREKVNSAIFCLCKVAMRKTKESCLDWLYVLPLCHFMSGLCEPFANLDYDIDKLRIQFNSRAEKFGYSDIQCQHLSGIVDRLYPSLEPLFAVDPLLLYDFIYICPVADLCSLFQKISAYLSLIRLSSQPINSAESAKQWKSWLEPIIPKIAEEQTERQLSVATINAAKLLMKYLFGKVTVTSEHHLHVLKSSIRCLLFALSKAQSILNENIVTEAFGMCELTLRDWVANSGVIGGSLFGGSVSSWPLYPKKLQYALDELKMWQNLLSLQTPQDRKITKAWNDCIGRVIYRRVKEVPSQHVIELVYMLEKMDDVHSMLSTMFMDRGMEVIDKFTESHHGNLDAFGESQRVGELFGRLLEKEYPKIMSDEFTISLDDLLSWSYWPDFIKIYNGTSKAKEGLPHKCLTACSFAISQLTAVSQQLQEGDITVMELQKIVAKEEHMKRLCNAASAEPKNKNRSHVQVLTGTLQLRLHECKSFKEQQGFLLHLCQRIHPQIEGISQAKGELQMDYNSYKINTLCTQTKSGIDVVCFTKASCLLSFAWKFHIMTKKFTSSLFDATWCTIMQTARKSNATISDIESQVWKPAFKQCQNLLDQLHSQSMTLADVEKHFKYYGEQELENELNVLCCGVSECDQNTNYSKGWIRQRVLRIEEYRKLRNYRDAANIFLKLRDSLKLTKGDFKHVERISEEVSSSMRGQTLADVSDELVKAGTFLRGFTGDQIKCIQMFTECQEIVQWIQSTTKDVSDLQNFVNVALATAAGGEDDFANDRLSNLRTVGSGFSSLIYKLEEVTGFHGLAQRCSSVWTAFKDNRKLPKILADCNRDLKWYKSVKETQGSVEVTSFGQMESILNYGHYTIAGKRNMAMHRIHDVIRLTLVPQGDKKLIKTSYTLDELRDLESKLILITGSKAENRATVEQFLNTLHCVVRIAEVLIALQQKGNVKYIGWSMEFHCQPLLVEDLQTQAKEMEDELIKWNSEVDEARKRFYELNYYTTHQLLVLRSELGKLKCLHSTNPLPQKAQVMALLESISSEMTLANVKSVVQQVISQLPEDLDMQKSPIPGSDQAGAGNIEPYTKTPPPVSQIMPAVEHLHVSHVQTLPYVSLSEEKLNVKQKEYFTNVIENYGYHKMTALKAIEEVGTGDWNDIENWVKENGDKFDELFQDEGNDDEEAGESCEEDEEISSESEDQNEDIGRDEEKNLGTVPSQSGHACPSSYYSQTKVVVTHIQPIDETNEEVRQLLEAEMGTLEECIRAVETYGTAEVAMTHMMEIEERGLFHDEVPLQGIMEEPTVCSQPTTLGSGRINITVKKEDQYLMLNQLGRVLHELSCNFPAAVEKRSENVLKPGQPHLIVVAPEMVLRAALSLYMEDTNLPMPTPEEMLICNQHTSAEEVIILWRRAICDPEFKRIFCLVHAEKLSYQTADRALRSLTDIIQGQNGYRLVMICSNHDEDKSPIISKLHLYRRPYVVPADINKYRTYLRSHFVDEEQPSFQQLQTSRGVLASIVDPEGSSVRVVSSTRAGMGKTLFITRMAEKLQSVTVGDNIHITIPIHGPQVTTDSIMQYLVESPSNSHGIIFHFDISPSVLWQVDTILFSLLIQRGLCDSQGRVWRNHSAQLYAIEVTLPEIQPGERQPISERFTLSVLEMLPSVKCISPKHALPLMTCGSVPEGSIVMDEEEFKSEAYQRVYQYLRLHVMNHNLDQFSYIKGSIEGSTSDCLQVILKYCGVKDPSWAEIRHFVKFLDLQLQSCECSSFCNEDFVGDVMAGLKSFVVKFMMRMSRDFSTSSLRGEVAQENEEVEQNEDTLGQYQVVERKQWEKSSHPYIFFNHDRASITFVGFMVTRNGDLIDPAQRGVTLESGIMTQQLYTGLRHQRVDFNDDYRKWNKEIMIQKISTVMGIEWPYDPDETYVLTVDNLIKILAIQMRFRCGIPVVIMGETGCGKTRLIRFMCDLAAQGSGKRNMLILKVHGGISENDIITFMTKAEDNAKENRTQNLDTVVFFDEANTTEAIGLIKEIMCDRRLCGKPISQDLKFIAACNPYRRHSERMIEKLRSAGLGFYVRETDTQQKLGKIPLRELVYRVIDLPPSMRPLVYDFGQLMSDTERDYTEQIVHDHVKKHSILSQQHDQLIPAVAQVLAWSQRYMREKKDECSFVSLRDVERAMLVFVYFFEKMDLFRDAMNRKERKEKGVKDDERSISLPVPDTSQDLEVSHGHILVEVTSTTADTTLDLTRSLILAISVCYHARLSDRTDYEERIAQQFKAPLSLSGGVEQFRNEIRWCQEVLLESMVLGENIARNAALRENVFMMAICLDLRIPLFLVGKPGSSKSLAKSIVADSMRGQASQNDLLRSFKQVHMFSYQCSQLSTPQSVIEVFNTAKRFQKNQDTSKYVSVVVLDEVGLAEDSPNLPLKALHPLLEDGTEGADENAEVVERNKRVAFIGISNWALDPAKMNRGVMVTRGDPDTKELVVSAQGICHNEKNDEVNRRLSSYFDPLAEAYSDICKHQKRQFFGLRDFYSLIKMLYWMCEKTNMPPTGPQLVHAIKRNFGGLQDENIDPEVTFREKLPNNIDESPDLRSMPPEIHPFVNPDNSRRGLINTSLMTKETSWHGENRYLLFLTENYAALEILKQYLQDQDSGHDQQLLSHHPGEATLKPWEMEPFVLFGSSFPRDKEYTQVCRNINQIKICMEIGRTVILLNLENLYESLYDVLNQYYIHHGGNRYVDLGLQTHKVKCRVHEEFKLILIAEKTTVYDEFPTPLINRLEKHFVLYSSVLEDWQTETLAELEMWIKDFSHISNSQSRFKEKDAFVGYHKDVAAAVVFQASSQLRKMCGRWKDGEEHTTRHLQWQTALENRLLGECSLDELVEEEEGSDHWKQAVLLISQYLLLQTTPPAALVRLHSSKLRDQHNQLNRIYQSQHRASIEDFLNYHMLQEHHTRGGLLLQVTTHSHLLSSDEVDDLSSQLPLAEGSVHSFLLQEFDTELDFTTKVSSLFVQEEDSEGAYLLIIQCDSGHINGDLIACARYRIYDMRAKALLNKSQCIPITHVLFIIHLPVQAIQSSFVSFQGDPWVSCHIDELRASEEGAITLERLQGVSISELFYGGLEDKKETEPELKTQVSDSTSTSEGIMFERLPSVESEEEEMEIKERVMEMDLQVMDIEDEGGLGTSSGSKSVEELLEPMEDKEREYDRDAITGKDGLVTPSTENVLGKRSFPDMYTQCVRLNSCIQAAASRLQDSTHNKQRAAERVKLLIDIIPHKPDFPLEPDSFYSVLVSHIHRILRERENASFDPDWVLSEAMNIHNLQTGGTFKNVLSRKLDNVIIPFFSEIIAFIDRNCNLNLLQTVSPPTPLSQFWLKIFSSERAKQALHYDDMATGVQKVAMRDEDFECEFPFSWLVKELMDSQWDNAQTTGGSSRQQIHKQLCKLVSDTSLGEVLMSVQEDEQYEELYRRYIHDFVHTVHKCTHKQTETVKHEYKLIQDTLHNMIVKGDDFSSLDGHVTLTSRIAAVHVVYGATSECIHWFGQLASYYPGILAGMVQAAEQTVGVDDSMMLHLYAVERVLSELKPPIEANRQSEFSEDQTLRQWLSRLQKMSNAIESTLSLPSEHPLAHGARLKWQKIRALQLFTEHVLLNHGNLIMYARRLNLGLGEETNFLEYSTLDKVKRVLNNMLIKEHKSKEHKRQLTAIKKSCRNFFIEVVSGICFGQSSAPEDELVEMLLNIVFTEQGQEGEEGGEGEGRKWGTRDMTPYKEDLKDRDKSPVIRSFLLQLLLEHDTTKVKHHLNNYFDKSREALVGGVGVDQELCLLCTQCFEDALYKVYSCLPLGERMKAAIQLVTSAVDVLTKLGGFSQDGVSLDILEGVAKMRYGLFVVAELLQMQFNEIEGSLASHNQKLYGSVSSRLITEASCACTDERLNTIDRTGKSNTTGPTVYLLKLLVRQNGSSCMKKIIEKHKWVVPEELRRPEGENTSIDPFVIYNPVYSPIREEMSAAAYGRDYAALEERTADLHPQEWVPLLLSVYEVFTLSRASTQISKQLLPETIEKMNEIFLNCKALSREMQLMARLLVCNEQGGPLAALQVSAGQPGVHRTLSAVVIHSVASLLSRKRLHLLSPLVTLLIKPGNMAACYLPTMAEDMLPEARRIITGGQFYECRNGHPYFVGECGRPVQQATCNICGSAIGGQNHTAVSDNKTARTTDTTQTGHSLGHPTARGGVPSPERSLSPAACCIVRAIMHSALLWTSCNDVNATEGLLALVKSGLHGPQELPEFFWGHLERDMQLLAMALGKNFEEAAIVVHLVLQNILTSDPAQGTISMETLGTREIRDEWEKQFDQIYINPLLEKLEVELGDAMATILNGDNQEHDPLFYLVYEHTPVIKGSLEPHLWSYRPRITLENLTRYIHRQKTKLPILKEFLKEEAGLRATQYLPHIVKLQRRMFEQFHHRIDHKVARDRTMYQFISDMHNENVRNEYEHMVVSLQSAWGLVRDKLKDHAQLRVEDKYLQHNFGLDTTLDHFIPTTTGAGACTFALVHYLAYVHNNFIDWCRAKSKTSTWQEHKIQLPHIHACHLLNYASQLQSILLSHCHYSLYMGHGHEISYDLPALEKHILDRFIHGKPRILVDIPQVSYQKDVYTAATFASVRKKVAKQISLPARVQLDILRDLGSPAKLRKSLDVVEIVLGFLTSGGGKPSTTLVKYLKKLKMEKKTFSEKAKEHCNLEHILSLWQTLSVGLARVITLSGQEPFHTLNSELLDQLTRSQQQELDQVLPKCDLECLLGTLYEFIETYIRHINMREKGWSLLDTLPQHLDGNDLEVPQGLMELPKSITLAQTVATWKHIVHFQAKQRQE